MTVPSDSILEKVQALLRLASDEAATEHEASLAMERLQALLLKHNLDMADVEAADGVEPCPVVDEELDMGHLQWERMLVGRIARRNFCDGIISNGRYRIIGRKHNIEVVKEMCTWLAGQLSMLAATQAGVQEFMGEPVNGSWKNSFILGAINRIDERLRESEDGQDSNTRALVVDLAKETRSFLYDAYPNVRPGKVVTVHAGAYRAGVNAGDIVSVMPASKQVE